MPPKNQSSLSNFFGPGASSSAKPPPGRSAAQAVVISDSEEDAKPSKSAASASKSKKSTAVNVSDSEEDMTPAEPKSTAASSKKPTKSTSGQKASSSAAQKRKAPDTEDDDDFDDNEDDDDFEAPAPKKRAVGTPSKTTAKKTPPKKVAAKPKAAAMAVDDSDSDDEPKASKGKAKSTPKSAPKPKASTSKASKEAPAPVDDGTAVEGLDISEAINRFGDLYHQRQREKQQEAAGGPAAAKKTNWAQAKTQVAGPVMPGSKPIPEGKPNCLAAFTLVFTGELSSLSREEALDLAKRYGARVTGAPSSKTTHVVMGEGAGPSKIDKIKKSGLKCKIVDEDGFLQLIAQSKGGQLDEKQLKKIKDEEQKIKDLAKEMAVDKSASSSKAGASKSKDLGAAASGASRVGQELDPNATLWTTKYAPKKMRDLIGNKAGIEKLKNWLERWPISLASNFKKPGPDASGTFRAVLLSGAPGIGKTSAAHLVAHSLGYTPIELNASDARSKKLVELALRDALNNTNLEGWFKSGQQVDKTLNPAGIRITDKTVLIMDEVDGMSGGDRGGVGAINTLIKKTRVPIICICNDRRNPKMKPFETTTFQIQFRKPESQAIKSRLLSVAFAEKMSVPQEVMLSLIEAAQGDIRQVINMLSTWNLSAKSMNYEEGKALGDSNQKGGMHTPFTLFSELVGPYMFSQTSRKTINDKTDYYFQDPSLLPLLMHENYLKQRPATLLREAGPVKDMKTLDLFSKASASISDGDVIDAMIHGPQQHWSLMPHHGIASCVRPASFVYGTGTGFPSFPQWLGQNSKYNKLRRANTDIQAKMRLVASGSAEEIRLTYEPVLFRLLTQPLIEKSSDGIPDIISIMDEYFLGTEDRESILELGVDKNNGEEVSKKIPSATKAAFTRAYNASNHPIAFYKVTDLAAAKAKPLKGDAAPDLEEAYDVDDEVPDEEPENDDDDEVDLGKNKLVKAKKPKGAKAPKAAAKGKGKGKF